MDEEREPDVSFEGLIRQIVESEINALSASLARVQMRHTASQISGSPEMRQAIADIVQHEIAMNAKRDRDVEPASTFTQADADQAVRLLEEFYGGQCARFRWSVEMLQAVPAARPFDGSVEVVLGFPIGELTSVGIRYEHATVPLDRVAPAEFDARLRKLRDVQGLRPTMWTSVVGFENIMRIGPVPNAGYRPAMIYAKKQKEARSGEEV